MIYRITFFFLSHDRRSVFCISPSCVYACRRMYSKSISSRQANNTHVFFFLSFAHFYFPASGQAVVTRSVVPSFPRFLPLIFIVHRVQQSHCSSIFHRVLLTHALALSASQFVRKKKSPRIYTRMHSGVFELTKLTYTRLEDNLIRHRGDRHTHKCSTTRERQAAKKRCKAGTYNVMNNTTTAVSATLRLYSARKKTYIFLQNRHTWYHLVRYNPHTIRVPCATVPQKHHQYHIDV